MRIAKIILIMVVMFTLVMAPTPPAMATSPILPIHENPEWMGSIQQFDINYTEDWVNDIIDGVFGSIGDALMDMIEGFVDVFDDFKAGNIVEKPFFYSLVFIVLSTILMLFKRFG